MFSKENRRLLIIFTAIVFIGMTTIIGAVVLIQHDKQAATIWTIGGGILTYIFGYLRAEMRHAEAKTDRVVIGEAVLETKDNVKEIAEKTNGNLSRAVHDVAEEVRKAAHDPAPGQEGMPRNPAELQALIRTFVKTSDESCRAIAKDAGREAAVAVTRDTVRMVVEELRSSGALILPDKGKMEIIPGETQDTPKPTGGDGKGQRS